MARARKKPAATGRPEGSDYVVMGDLGTGETADGASPELTKRQIRDGERKYLVRMFLGGISPDADVHDQEFAAHVEDLHEIVMKRMGELERKPSAKLRVPMKDTQDHLTRTGQHPGNAVTVPGHWLTGDTFV